MVEDTEISASDILVGIKDTLYFILEEAPINIPREYKSDLDFYTDSVSWILDQLENPILVEWQLNKEFACWKLAELNDDMFQIEYRLPSCDQGEYETLFDERRCRKFILWIGKMFPSKSQRVINPHLPIKSRNPERDDWIKKRRDDGDSLNEIKQKLSSQHQGWEQIATEQGIMKVLERIEKRRRD